MFYNIRFKRGTVKPRLYVKVVGNTLETDVEITAPRYMRGDHYDLSCFQ